MGNTQEPPPIGQQPIWTGLQKKTGEFFMGIIHRASNLLPSPMKEKIQSWTAKKTAKVAGEQLTLTQDELKDKINTTKNILNALPKGSEAKKNQ